MPTVLDEMSKCSLHPRRNSVHAVNAPTVLCIAVRVALHSHLLAQMGDVVVAGHVEVYVKAVFLHTRDDEIRINQFAGSIARTYEHGV